MVRCDVEDPVPIQRTLLVSDEVPKAGSCRELSSQVGFHDPVVREREKDLAIPSGHVDAAVR
jgi:hypothetical protein